MMKKNSISDHEILTLIHKNIDMEKLKKFCNKTESELRKELFEINKNGKLASQMQQRIVDKVEIAPEETYTFFNSIKSHISSYNYN